MLRDLSIEDQFHLFLSLINVDNSNYVVVFYL